MAVLAAIIMGIAADVVSAGMAAQAMVSGPASIIRVVSTAIAAQATVLEPGMSFVAHLPGGDHQLRAGPVLRLAQRSPSATPRLIRILLSLITVPFLPVEAAMV
jgi:hypothetical protein